MNEREEVKQLTVLSGKGGTGKSTIIASLAYLLKDHVLLADADVDAADLYLIFQPSKSKNYDYYGIKKAEIDYDKCTKCGLCAEYCRFGAISENIDINLFKCEGCGLCHHICPEEAVALLDIITGQYFVSDTRIGKMVHAKLRPGEESSGLLVAEVRKIAKKVAEGEEKKLVLIDGSPGIGCPVISSLTGSDMALIVTEPTLSGKHDLERVLELLKNFRVRGYVIINRYDINEDISTEIEEVCAKETPVIAKIPYDPIFTQSMIQELSVAEYIEQNAVQNNIIKLLKNIAEHIKEEMKL